MNLTWLLLESVFILANLEGLMNAPERLREYSEEVAQEAPWRTDADDALPADWPREGRISLHRYQLRYRNGPLVLKGLDVDVGTQEKVGIVGRTGSGKSSLVNGLFRIVEPAAGSISIDGHDISELGLHTLRERLGLIPQDPGAAAVLGFCAPRRVP